jgi:3-hydroxybutyryl-CoA dehydrogenase
MSESTGIVPATAITTVCVLGAGTMGHGIAHVAALAGWQVRLYDVTRDAVDAGLARIRANLEGGVARGKVTAEAAAAASARLHACNDVAEAARAAELVIEAVPEQLELKRALFAEVEPAAAPGAILASNTSSLSIAGIAAGCRRPERVLGMHFFNPVHVMRLCELVRHDGTAPAALDTARAAARAMGKEPIVARDVPGFASSRLGLALGLEAMRMVEAGVASAADIDTAMKLGYGHPMGPLELTDLVGLDVRLAIADYLASALGPGFAPPAILRDKVARGELGKKSGQGFYRWQDGKPSG